jgi:hypothetical protein
VSPTAAAVRAAETSMNEHVAAARVAALDDGFAAMIPDARMRIDRDVLLRIFICESSCFRAPLAFCEIESNVETRFVQRRQQN